MKKVWPERALVGYVIAYYSSTPSILTNDMITQAIAKQYSVFVYAFGTIDGSNQVSLPENLTRANLQQQLSEIHQADGLALLSFGGANNTFTPGDNPKQAATQTVNFCRENGFDGVDLDLENVQVDAAYLKEFIEETRALDDSLFITAAPQIQGGYGGPASLLPQVFATEHLTSYGFDAILVQEYNQFGGAVFDGKKDTDVGFISNSFGPLTQIVPSGTKIVIGEPATESAGSGLSNPEDIVKDISAGNVLENPQYGGIMTWAINYDYDNNWIFAQGVASLIE